jgi:hypothetical protein
LAATSEDLWKKMRPEEHYRRILYGADREAWDHLADLIYLLLKRPFQSDKVQQRALSIDDQVRQTLKHILEKIRKNKLILHDERKFYGFLKIIVTNCLCEVLRSSSAMEKNIPLESVSNTLPSSHKTETLFITNILYEKIWQALREEAAMSDMERRAVELSWLMNKGLLDDIKNNSQLARKLTEEFQQKISYEKTGALIHAGQAKLQEYLEHTWLPEKKKKN